MDPIAQAIASYGWAAVVVYILVREALALAKKWLPENVKRTTAREEREAACQQRETEALEQIASALTVNNERLSIVEHAMAGCTTALAKANEGIAVLLDRRLRSRKTDKAGAAV